MLIPNSRVTGMASSKTYGGNRRPVFAKRA